MLLGKNRSRKSTHALGEASTSQIRDWVQRLKDQEGGRAPDVHKINGNMAWYERSNDTNHPMYQLYKSFNKDSRKLLEYVKSQVPGEFETSSNGSGGSDNGSSNNGGGSGSSSGSGSSNGGSGSGGSSSNPPAATGMDPNMKKYLMYGGAAVGGIFLLSMFTGN